jgi:uncharacterized membrane protein
MTPVLVIHIAAGSAAILFGGVAAAVRKGQRLHRAFGTVFFVSMLIMSALGAYLAVFGPEPAAGAAPPKASVAVGTLTLYLVATAWMTVRRQESCVGVFETGACLLALGTAAALLIFGLQAAKGRSGEYAPYFVFAAFAVFAAGLDVKMILHGGLSGSARLARHLWRVCFALFFATSFFFIGQQKVMPSFMHGSPILVALGVAPLALMIFWLIRIRFKSTHRGAAAFS